MVRRALTLRAPLPDPPMSQSTGSSPCCANQGLYGSAVGSELRPSVLSTRAAELQPSGAQRSCPCRPYLGQDTRRARGVSQAEQNSTSDQPLGLTKTPCIWGQLGNNYKIQSHKTSGETKFSLIIIHDYFSAWL